MPEALAGLTMTPEKSIVVEDDVADLRFRAGIISLPIKFTPP